MEGRTRHGGVLSAGRHRPRCDGFPSYRQPGRRFGGARGTSFEVFDFRPTRCFTVRRGGGQEGRDRPDQGTRCSYGAVPPCSERRLGDGGRCRVPRSRCARRRCGDRVTRRFDHQIRVRLDDQSDVAGASGRAGGDVLVASLGFGKSGAKKLPSLTAPAGWSLATRTNQGFGCQPCRVLARARGRRVELHVDDRRQRRRRCVPGSLRRCRHRAPAGRLRGDPVRSRDVGDGAVGEHHGSERPARRRLLRLQRQGRRHQLEPRPGDDGARGRVQLDGKQVCQHRLRRPSGFGPDRLEAGDGIARQDYGLGVLSGLRAAETGPVDTTPPVVSGVGVGSVGSTSATVSWVTDEPSDSLVEYGLTSGYGSSSGLDATLRSSHSVVLGGLSAGTTTTIGSRAPMPPAMSRPPPTRPSRPPRLHRVRCP